MKKGREIPSPTIPKGFSFDVFEGAVPRMRTRFLREEVLRGQRNFDDWLEVGCQVKAFVYDVIELGSFSPSETIGPHIRPNTKIGHVNLRETTSLAEDSFIAGVDVGGTFTDSVVVDEAGRIYLGKDLTTYPDFSQGILNALKDAAGKRGVRLEDFLKRTSIFLHSSTVSENMMVTRSGVKAGLITTKGFEDTVIMMRGGYGRWSGLTEDEMKDPVHTDKPPYLVSRSLIRGLNERIDYKGKVVVPLQHSEVADVVSSLVEKEGVKSIGVSFLWSFTNPSHELLVKRFVREKYPDVYVTISSEIAPILGEYERTSSVVINAYLGPTVSGYIDRLEGRLTQMGLRGSFLVMLSHGGLVKPSEASEKPIGFIESGPVGGLVGSNYLGKILGLNNIIACDMGGTTFKVGIIREGLIDYQREPMVARYHFAFPKMDIISIGAGGGSIVWVESRTMVPKIGPDSAGSNPGPVCYDLGGEKPTVTDIDLLLGYLDPNYFLGGRIKLNVKKTMQAFKEKIAEPLGMDVIDAAASIYRLANSQMYDLLHKVTVEQGLDPREYSMFVYGGAAGMHAATFGSEIGVPNIVVPNTASVHGAFGLVSSDVIHEYTTAKVVRLPASLEEVNKPFEKLTQEALRQLTDEGFKGDRVTIARAVDMRFRRQVHVVTTPVEVPFPMDAAGLEDVTKRFERLYEQRYGRGSAFAEAGTEIVRFRLRATGSIGWLRLYKHPLSKNDASKARVDRRRAYFERDKDFVETDTYRFDALEPGNEVFGPSIILTPITTLVVNPGQQVSVDEYKNMIIRPKGRET